MREIKFRGKTLSTGEWVYGYFTRNPRIAAMIYCRDLGGSYEVIPETVGEYTGLKDKNSKEIWEGDIIKCTWSDDTESKRPDLWTYGIIRFGQGEVDASDYEKYSIEIIGFYIEYIKGCDNNPSSLLHYKIIEIIGNIHENPVGKAVRYWRGRQG